MCNSVQQKLGHTTHFGTVSLLSMFFINRPLVLQKLSLYTHISNIYSGLGFEFGPQRIRDLAIVSPQSVLNCMQISSSFWIPLLVDLVSSYFCAPSSRRCTIEPNLIGISIHPQYHKVIFKNYAISLVVTSVEYRIYFFSTATSEDNNYTFSNFP